MRKTTSSPRRATHTQTVTKKPRIVKREQQTVRVKGKRTRIVSITRADGSVSVRLETPDVLEIDLQAAAVKEIKRMPEYAKSAEDVLAGRGEFTLAADQNGSGFRGRNAAVKLKAAGMAAGEPDLRLYFSGGVLRCIEFKGANGILEDSQERRFPLLRALGFEIHVVEASTTEDAAAQAVALVRGWLAENDNQTVAKAA